MNISNYKNVYVVDFGKTTATISYNGKKSRQISHADVLNLPDKIPAGSLLISEYAHLGCPRKEYSMAQHFYAEILLNFYEKCRRNNIILKLFPQKLTPRAAAYSKLGKSDLNDPVSIYRLLKGHPKINMMDPPSFAVPALVQYYWNWKEKTNKILNVARMTKYDFDESVDDQNKVWLLENLEEIYNRLSETARSCFGLEKYKKTGKLKIKTQKDWLFNMPQIYSVLGLIREPNGKLRLNERTNDFPRNSHAKRYLFCMTPFHHRGGVARSNLYFHGAMNWISGQVKKEHKLDFKRKVMEDKESRTVRRGNFTKKEDKIFLIYRQKYSKAIMELYSLLKEMLKADLKKKRPKVRMEPTF